MDQATIDRLVVSGFAPKRYKGQEGVFYRKDLRLGEMPYAKEHIVDDDDFFESTKAVIEVTPDGRVQFFIEERDYLEGPHPIDSDDGQALLKDAGFVVECQVQTQRSSA